MKKIYLVFITSLVFPFFLANSIIAAIAADFKNQQAPSIYIYPQEFDNLVMDLIIPSGTNGEDKLKAITLENVGIATDLNDIEKLKLWSDAGPVGFQGMEIDKELGTFIFYSQNNSWYLNNLSESVPAGGLRIFISADITRGTVASKTIQMRIPLLNDANKNSIFDLGDLGVFMDSKNNGPTDEEIINSYYQEIRKFTGTENLPPKSVITDPKGSATLNAGTSYTIKGVARDQGGSTPQWVKIGIDDVWYDVTATDSNYATWEYNWSNTSAGTHKLKTQSADWVGNIEVAINPITVTVSSPSQECICSDWKNDSCGAGGCDSNKMHQTRSCSQTGCLAESQCIENNTCLLNPKEIQIQELKAKIIEIQEKILELLNQLIQFTQLQISQLKK
jgi:hypothetical protein